MQRVPEGHGGAGVVGVWLPIIPKLRPPGGGNGGCGGRSPTCSHYFSFHYHCPPTTGAVGQDDVLLVGGVMSRARSKGIRCYFVPILYSCSTCVLLL